MKPAQDIQNFNEIKKTLDQAIDEMDIEQIEKSLAKLSAENSLPFMPEDSKLFAKRIITQNRKDYHNMKKNYKKLGTLTASALLVIVLGTSAAYATGLLNQFTFFNKETTVVVKSNQTLSEKEAKELAKTAASEYGKPQDPEATVLEATPKDFSSLAEVQKAFGTNIVLPSYIPSDFEMDKTIHTETLSENNFNIYATYTSKENSKRLFGVSVIQRVLDEDSTSISITDSVYKDKYTSPAGTTYTLFDENGGIIAQAKLGDIEYNLCFMGLDEKEMHQIIDSTDLTAYMQ